MKSFMLLIALLLAACSDSSLNSKPAGWGEKRIELFERCMELAQVNQQSTHYSPNQKVVDSCSRQAYYMANGLLNSGYFDAEVAE